MKKKSKYYDIRTMMQAYPDAKYYKIGRAHV